MTCDWSSHQAIAFSTCFRRFSSLVQNDLVIVWASQIGDTPSVTYSLNGLIKLSALSASSWSDIDQPFHDIGSSSSPSPWPSFLTVGKISFSLLSPNVLISSPYHIYRMFLKYSVQISPWKSPQQRHCCWSWRWWGIQVDSSGFPESQLTLWNWLLSRGWTMEASLKKKE